MLDNGTTSPVPDSFSQQGALGGGLPTSISVHGVLPLPNASLQTVGHKTFTTQDTQTDMCTVVTFSAQTCLELLPSLTTKQLAYETAYFQSLIPDHDTHGRKTDYVRFNALFKSLMESTKVEIDKVLDNTATYQELIYDFSCTVEKARLYIEELKLPICDHAPASVTQTPTPADTASTTTPEEPVQFLDFDINIDLDDLRDIHFNEEGNRQTAYFGPVDYTYGNKCHKAAHYPNSPALSHVFNTLSQAVNDPNFTRDKYSCLITKYEDGTSYLPYHSDNEHSITPNSLIYTVSLGETRTIKFQNITRTLEHEYELRHGTAHVMTQSSQDTWEHSILKSPLTQGPRISLTFRQHTNPTSNRVPPITKPTPPRKIILFLTDSIHNSIPYRLFPEEYLFVKKVLYRLADIDKYVSEFKHADYVFISCGVNDLSRYSHTAHTLAKHMTYKLRDYCLQFPQTTFIFNSILRTDIGWLNKEVEIFNRCIFNLTNTLNINQNLWFLDTHWCAKNMNTRVIDIGPRGNKIHLTQEAKGRISQVIRDCIVGLDKCRSDLYGIWPLRPEYRSIISLSRY